MKKRCFIYFLILFLVFTIYLPHTSAQDIQYTILEGHRDAVSSVSFSPDGKTIASGSWDYTIRLWNASTGETIRTLTGHRGSVRSVSFSPDGQILASGSYDDTIRLWNASTGNTIRTLSGHRSTVLSVSFSPDGQILASGSSDDTIRLWNALTGDTIRTLSGHRDSVYSVSFSPDGQILTSGSWDDTIRLWDVATGDPINTLRGHRDAVRSVSFSPDGQTLASGSHEDTIRLWKLPAKVSITPFPVESPAIGEQISINVSIAGGENVGGYQLTVGFDPAALRYVEAASGDYLSEGAFFVPPVVSRNKVTLGSTSLGDVSSGDGTLATVTFEVVDVKESNLILSDVILTDSDGEHLANSVKNGSVVEPAAIPSSAVVSITPSSVLSPAIGGQLTFNVGITGAENITDYHFTWEFDRTALEYISSSEVYNLVDGVGSGDGTLSTRTFKVLDVKPSTVSLSGYFIGTDGLRYIPTFENAEVVVLTSSAVVSITPSSVLSSAIGEELTFNVDIKGGQHIAEYYNFRLSYEYDKTALELIPGGIISTKADGAATLVILKFKVLAVKPSTLSVSGYLIGDDGNAYIPTFESAEILEPIFGDVNRDGVVDISDLVQIGSSFGQQVPAGSGNPADVNEDRIVNIVDLVKVAGAISAGAAAPTVLSHGLEGAPTRADVQEWLTQAQQLNLTDATSQQGIYFLKQLLAALTPEKTSLLPNYPNPFNPETWIPYQLAKLADVTLTIYAVDGKLVRKLELGHQPIGIYQHRSRAAYWDGKNSVGESVASGVYFYTLTAGKFTATRKMLITK